MTHGTCHQKESSEDEHLSRSHSRVAHLTLWLLAKKLYLIPAHGYVLCRLWRLRPDPLRMTQPAVYAVGMEGLGYRRLCCIGTDEDRAREIFDLLVRNTVTPCALGDVLEEFCDDLML